MVATTVVCANISRLERRGSKIESRPRSRAVACAARGCSCVVTRYTAARPHVFEPELAFGVAAPAFDLVAFEQRAHEIGTDGENCNIVIYGPIPALWARYGGGATPPSGQSRTPTS